MRRKWGDGKQLLGRVALGMQKVSMSAHGQPSVVIALESVHCVPQGASLEPFQSFQLESQLFQWNKSAKLDGGRGGLHHW